MFFIHVRGFVATLLTLNILMVSVSSGTDTVQSADNEPVPIDFSDVVEENGRSGTDGDRPGIRIAVAAMISPKETYHYYIELLNHIGDSVGRNVLFTQKKTYAEVNRMLERKELDLAFVCSGPYVTGKKEFGMEILAVPVCHGKTVYYSYFIVSIDSGIDAFEDLKGKTFAFTDPLSNTGFLVPTYYLAQRDETPESYFGDTFFTHSHDNSIQAVAKGIADGAAVDSLIFDFMRGKKKHTIGKVRVIEKSPPYGIPPVVVHPSMDPAMKEKLQTLFLSIHESPEGQRLLANLQIDRFVEGHDDAYDSVRELLDFLESYQH
jgi:phosphonate transport system substrate-binding protein